MEKSRNNLVVTIAIGSDYAQFAKLTHPTIKAYADKIGADFLCIEEKALSGNDPQWEKFQVANCLEKYDRVIYIDSDVIVRNDTPNLFEIVPETQLGMFEEGRFTQRGVNLLVDACNAYDVTISDWNKKFYNRCW